MRVFISVFATVLLTSALILLLWPEPIFKLASLAERRGLRIHLRLSRLLDRYLADRDRRHPRSQP